MKKLIIAFATILLVNSAAFAQKRGETAPKPRERAVSKKAEPENETKSFTKLSVEVEVGNNKPVASFGEGYYTANMQDGFPINDINHYGIGVRYMFSNIFGLRLDGAFEDIKNHSNSASLPFHTTQMRGGIQGVMNLGRVCRFETFTSRLNVLAHAGFQISQLKVMLGENESLKEMNGGAIVGLTPQVRILNNLSLFLDFSAMINFRQHLNWDGSMSKDTNLGGTMYNMSAGLSFNFANSSKKHADWFVPPVKSSSSDDNTLNRLDQLEALMKDVDKDGVPDYLDAENNTPNGVAVDRKGRPLNVNRTGIDVDQTPAVAQDGKNGTDNSSNPYGGLNNDAAGNTIINNNSTGGGFNSADAVSDLIKNGYLNIFYDVNIDTPNIGSTDNVYYVVMFLKKHPDAKVNLQGFTDPRGGDSFNKDLSNRRVSNLKKLFIACGISGDRIGIEGLGIDKTVPSDSKIGLDLARRVSITLE